MRKSVGKKAFRLGAGAAKVGGIFAASWQNVENTKEWKRWLGTKRRLDKEYGDLERELRSLRNDPAFGKVVSASLFGDELPVFRLASHLNPGFEPEEVFCSRKPPFPGLKALNDKATELMFRWMKATESVRGTEAFKAWRYLSLWTSSEREPSLAEAGFTFAGNGQFARSRARRHLAEANSLMLGLDDSYRFAFYPMSRLRRDRDVSVGDVFDKAWGKVERSGAYSAFALAVERAEAFRERVRRMRIGGRKVPGAIPDSMNVFGSGLDEAIGKSKPANASAAARMEAVRDEFVALEGAAFDARNEVWASKEYKIWECLLHRFLYNNLRRFENPKAPPFGSGNKEPLGNVEDIDEAVRMLKPECRFLAFPWKREIESMTLTPEQRLLRAVFGDKRRKR